MATVSSKKPVVPTEKQRVVLDALSNGRKVSISEVNGKKVVSLTSGTGKPVKDAPKLDRVTIEACQKKGWVCTTTGTLTDEGKKAKKLK